MINTGIDWNEEMEKEETLKARDRETKTQKNRMQNKIIALEEENATLKDNLTAEMDSRMKAEQLYADLNVKVIDDEENSQKKINELKGNIICLEDKVKIKQAKIDLLEEDNNNDKQQKINDMQDRITELEASETNNGDKIKQLETLNDEKQQKIHNIRNDIIVLETKETAKNAIFKQLETNCSNLQFALDTQLVENDTLSTTMDTTKSLLIDKEKEIENLILKLCADDSSTSSSEPSSLKPKILIVGNTNVKNLIDLLPKFDIDWEADTNIVNISDLSETMDKPDQVKKYKKYDLIITLLGTVELKSGMGGKKVFNLLIRAVTKMQEKTKVKVSMCQLPPLSFAGAEVLVTNSLIKACKIATVSTLLVQESLRSSPYNQVLQSDGFTLSDIGLLKFSAALVEAVGIPKKCQKEDCESENDDSDVNDSDNDDSSDDEHKFDFAAALKERATEATEFKKDLIGIIIGANGGFIKPLQEETRTRVHITKWMENSISKHGAIVKGQRMNVITAIKRIQKRLKDTEDWQSKPSDNDEKVNKPKLKRKQGQSNNEKSSKKRK